MNTTQLIIFALLQHGPQMARDIQKIFTIGRDPTQTEWNELFARAEKTYKELVPNTKLSDAQLDVLPGQQG